MVETMCVSFLPKQMIKTSFGRRIGAGAGERRSLNMVDRLARVSDTIWGRSDPEMPDPAGVRDTVCRCNGRCSNVPLYLQTSFGSCVCPDKQPSFSFLISSSFYFAQAQWSVRQESFKVAITPKRK
jgi:hypothetical protein